MNISHRTYTRWLRNIRMNKRKGKEAPEEVRLLSWHTKTSYIRLLLHIMNE